MLISGATIARHPAALTVRNNIESLIVLLLTCAPGVKRVSIPHGDLIPAAGVLCEVFISQLIDVRRNRSF
jgi:hypothetical protein